MQRRQGSVVLNLTCEISLKQYQDGIGGVDYGDQYQEIGAGFASKSHYKKWHKHVFFGICDFMLLNSYFAWNMSLTDSNVKG